MTPQEILKEIYKLPAAEQDQITESLLENNKRNIRSTPGMSREEFLQHLFDKNLITHIPKDLDDEDDNFEPIEIEGEPLSETIIRERR